MFLYEITLLLHDGPCGDLPLLVAHPEQMTEAALQLHANRTAEAVWRASAAREFGLDWSDGEQVERATERAEAVLAEAGFVRARVVTSATARVVKPAQASPSLRPRSR